MATGRNRDPARPRRRSPAGRRPNRRRRPLFPSVPTITVRPTSMPAPSEPTRDGAVTFGAPDPLLLPASPPEATDWASVGPGWLLVDHLRGGMYSDLETLDRRGLYLVSPDDGVYGVSALPTDGSRIVTASPDARLVLLELYDPVCEDGCTCPGGAPVTVETDQSDDREVEAHVYGYNLLDLPTTTSRPMLDPVTLSVCEPGVFSHSVDDKSRTSDSPVVRRCRAAQLALMLRATGRRARPPRRARPGIARAHGRRDRLARRAPPTNAGAARRAP